MNTSQVKEAGNRSTLFDAADQLEQAARLIESTKEIGWLMMSGCDDAKLPEVGFAIAHLLSEALRLTNEAGAVARGATGKEPQGQAGRARVRHTANKAARRHKAAR